MHVLFLAILAMLACARPAVSDQRSPVGLWKTIDDYSGKPRGFVRIYEANGQLFGKIERTVDPEEAKLVCDRCGGDRHNQPIIGLVVIRAMKRRGAEYSGGDILDPESGWVYRCRLRLMQDGAMLEVRGYIGISLFGRSQHWFRERVP